MVFPSLQRYDAPPPSTKAVITVLLVQCLFLGAQSVDITKYIAAEEVDWDFIAATGINNCTGAPFIEPASLYTIDGLGHVLRKARFFEYTDANFSERVPVPDDQAHLGLLGPLISAGPNDTIVVTLFNLLNFSINFEIQGMTSPCANVSTATAPNDTATYQWVVPVSAGPAGTEPDTKLWLYKSTIDPDWSDNAGLIGPVLITRSGLPMPPPGRDIITVFHILDENVSPYYETNLQIYNNSAVAQLQDSDLHESLLKHSINGLVFCNVPALEMTIGEAVRWHLASVGSESDRHTAHWHGNTLLWDGQRADQVMMIPGSVRSVDFYPREAGTWLLHCHVNDHIKAGMLGLYTVFSSQTVSNLTTGGLNGTVDGGSGGSATRRYYIAAEEVQWNYAPTGGDVCEGVTATAQGVLLDNLPPTTEKTVPFTNDALQTFGSPNSLGSPSTVFNKGVYIEYTDGSFTTPVIRPADDSYLGFLGPILRAEVGDTIEVVFLNRLNVSVSLHPHGVAYDKASEGAPYNDGTGPQDKLDDAVSPGDQYTYTWQVPESAGPGPGDPSTLGWLYHSHTDEITDVYAGLVGAILIGQPGAFRRMMETNRSNSNSLALGDAVDVEREAVFLFAVIDEGESILYVPPPVLDLGMAPNSEAGTESSGSSTMHSINGYVACNGAPLLLKNGASTRFHFISIGSEVDIHTPTLQGASWLEGDMRRPALTMMPGVMRTVDVRVDALQLPGPALLECRVAEHFLAGMRALVVIEDTNALSSTVQASSSSLVAVASSAQDGANSSLVRRPYFVAAEETVWDYAPMAQYACDQDTGLRPFTSEQQVYTTRFANTIGPRYAKALFRRYADINFVQRVPVPAEQGLLGPVIAVEVGDVLDITFVNRLSFPANLRLDGDFVPINGSADPDAPVDPGGIVTYHLLVSESSGPGLMDKNTVAYGYTSSVDVVNHPMAGLAGIVVVGLPGTFAGANASNMPAIPIPSGVDRLIPLFISIMNENDSPYFTQNTQGMQEPPNSSTTTNSSASPPSSSGDHDESTLQGDGVFYESNLKHSINGFIYCNGPDISVNSSQFIRVVVLTLGSESDLHGIQVEGQSIMISAANLGRASIEPLMAAVTVTVDVGPMLPGRFNISCAVHDHIDAGMQATLDVANIAPNVTSDATHPSQKAMGIIAAASLATIIMLST